MFKNYISLVWPETNMEQSKEKHPLLIIVENDFGVKITHILYSIFY